MKIHPFLPRWLVRLREKILTQDNASLYRSLRKHHKKKSQSPMLSSISLSASTGDLLSGIALALALGAAVFSCAGAWISKRENEIKEQLAIESVKAADERAIKALQLAKSISLMQSPRSIAHDKFMRMIKESPKGKVTIWYTPSDEECTSFAQSLWWLFNRAGWKVEKEPMPAEFPKFDAHMGTTLYSGDVVPVYPTYTPGIAPSGVSIISSEPYGPLVHPVVDIITSIPPGSCGQLRDEKIPKDEMILVIGQKPLAILSSQMSERIDSVLDSLAANAESNDGATKKAPKPTR